MIVGIKLRFKGKRTKSFYLTISFMVLVISFILALQINNIDRFADWGRGAVDECDGLTGNRYRNCLMEKYKKFRSRTKTPTPQSSPTSNISFYSAKVLPDACRNTNNTTFANCWRDQVRSCVFVVDSGTKEIDTNNAYCLQAGVCKFKNSEITCKKSLNPIQSAVNVASSKNNSLSTKYTKYEVYLEPGNFSVEQTCFDHPGNQSCSGFVQSNGKVNAFAGFRFAVQIPSFTKLSGTLLNGNQVSNFYVTEESYNAWGNNIYTPAVWSLLYLTNVLSSNENNNTAIYANSYLPSVQNPVTDVTIENLRLLGVGGDAKRVVNNNVTVSQPYCDDSQCKYRYTSSYAISAGKVGSPTRSNIKILNNKMENFQAFIYLMHIFGIYLPAEGLGDLNGDGLLDVLRAEGTPTDPIQIKNNYMAESVGADQVITIGDNIVIEGNTLKNNYNNWSGNPCGFGIFANSKNVIVRGNRVENYLTAINFEGPNPTSIKGRSGELETDRQLALGPEYSATGNVLENNIFENVLVCANIQRQVNATVRNNTCTFNEARYKKLASKAYYSPASKYQYIASYIGRSITQDEAMQINNSGLGAPFLFRTSQNTRILQNTFTGFPRGFIVEIVNWLKNGHINNVIKKNKFNTTATKRDELRNYALGQGVADQFYSVTWSSFNTDNKNNKICTDNIFLYPSNNSRFYKSIPSVVKIKPNYCL